MRDITKLHPELQRKIGELVLACTGQGLKIGFSECVRTVEEQNALYAKGRTAPGAIVTNAKGSDYSSQHQWGIAADFYRNDGKGAFDNTDHKEELTEENYENPEISLNPDNVVLVHQRCHNLIHDKLGYIEKKVYIVYGSPLSGKSSYVKSLQNEGDLIVDIDNIWQALSGCERYIKPLRLRANVFQVRDIRDDGTGVYAVKKGDIAKILNKPNQFQTTADFLESITTLLFLNYNVFIIPTYYEWYDDNRQYHKVYDGLYPIVPTQVDFFEDAAGQMYTKFTFENGKSYLINYKDVIHWKFRNSSNLLMGGDKSGRPNHNALLQTLALNHELLQGVSKAMKATYAVNAVVKIPTVMGKEKSENAIKELNEKLKNSESGLAAIDMKAEYIPIKKEVKLVDKDTLEFIDQKILRTFGVPLPILTGDYTKAQYEAFYQKTIEPLIISLSQVLTDKLLSDGERSHGNLIKLYPKELIFMSMSETLEMIRLVGDSGGLYENEKRTALGLMPLEELNGVRMQSLNYANVEIADKYQLGKVDGRKEA